MADVCCGCLQTSSALPDSGLGTCASMYVHLYSVLLDVECMEWRPSSKGSGNTIITVSMEAEQRSGRVESWQLK